MTQVDEALSGPLADPGVLPPLATADDWLAGQPAGTVPPPNLDAMLAAASAVIRRYCGWHVAPVLTMTQIRDGSGSASQRLPSLRVVDVLAVVQDGTDVDVSTLEWSADGFMRHAGSPYGYRGCGGRWTGRLRGLTVTYAHGFDDDEAGPLATLCLSLVNRSMAAPHGYMTAETTGTTTISYGGRNVDERPGSMTLLGYEQAQLDAYRLPGRRSG